MNRAGKIAGALLVAIALQASLATDGTFGGGGITPQPPDYLIEIVRGFPIYLQVPEINEASADEVRFSVDGTTVQTDSFAPFGEEVRTRRFDRLGISTDVVHSFTATALEFGEPVATLAEYHLLIHPLPLIPRVHVVPLAVKGRTSLVGFQLRGIGPGEQVKAWGRGFRHTSGHYPLPLVWIKNGSSSRTYTVPGGLEWRKSSHPRITFSFLPRGFKTKYGFSIRGRTFVGILRTKRNGNTGIRQIDGWERCNSWLQVNERPPPRQSCIYF